MKNLIPQHLFEMAKYSETDMIQKMSDVLDAIYMYDYTDLINEIYGDTFEYLKNMYGNDSVKISNSVLYEDLIPNINDLYKKDKFVSILDYIVKSNSAHNYEDFFGIFWIICQDDDGKENITAFNCGVTELNTINIRVINKVSHNRYLPISFNSVESTDRVFNKFLKELEYEMKKTNLE